MKRVEKEGTKEKETQALARKKRNHIIYIILYLYYMRAWSKEQIRSIYIYILYFVLLFLPVRTPFPIPSSPSSSYSPFPSYFSLLRHPRAVIGCVLLLEFHTRTTGPRVLKKNNQ